MSFLSYFSIHSSLDWYYVLVFVPFVLKIEEIQMSYSALMSRPCGFLLTCYFRNILVISLGFLLPLGPYWPLLCSLEIFIVCSLSCLLLSWETVVCFRSCIGAEVDCFEMFPYITSSLCKMLKAAFLLVLCYLTQHCLKSGISNTLFYWSCKNAFWLEKQ